MQHARLDYASIQDTSAAIELAHYILNGPVGFTDSLRLRQLARQVIGMADCGKLSGMTAVRTNGTLRIIPDDEPVFLIRGQDNVGGAAVRMWASLAETAGASPDIVKVARDHANKMDAWPKKKVADLPAPVEA